MYHPKMKKVKTVAVVLVSIRFWHCVSSDCCSECQFESCPGKTEVSYCSDYCSCCCCVMLMVAGQWTVRPRGARKRADFIMLFHWRRR